VDQIHHKRLQDHTHSQSAGRTSVARLHDRTPVRCAKRTLHSVHVDEDINSIDAPTPTPTTLGPMTRARARQLNHQVSSFLTSCPLDLDNGGTCALVLPRNDGEDQKGRQIVRAGFGLQDSNNL
jgi:hypothetical protein